jgi:glycyl-tRNA synthetase beta subunit
MFEKMPTEKLKELKKEIDQLKKGYKCRGNCGYCDGKGNITIPQPSAYEILLFMHNVVADFNFRQAIILIDSELKAREKLGDDVTVSY